MPIVHIIVLAAVQGITEFLPVSSSGHLILVPNLMGWTDQGRVIDVAVHIGTLLAVMLYFWRDIAAMVGAFFRCFRRLAQHRPLDKEFWLMVNLIIATIPAVIAGVASSVPRWGPSRLTRMVPPLQLSRAGAAGMAYHQPCDERRPARHEGESL